VTPERKQVRPPLVVRVGAPSQHLEGGAVQLLPFASALDFRERPHQTLGMRALPAGVWLLSVGLWGLGCEKGPGATAVEVQVAVEQAPLYPEAGTGSPSVGGLALGTVVKGKQATGGPAKDFVELAEEERGRAGCGAACFLKADHVAPMPLPTPVTMIIQTTLVRLDANGRYAHLGDSMAVVRDAAWLPPQSFARVENGRIVGWIARDAVGDAKPSLSTYYASAGAMVGSGSDDALAVARNLLKDHPDDPAGLRLLLSLLSPDAVERKDLAAKVEKLPPETALPAPPKGAAVKAGKNAFVAVPQANVAGGPEADAAPVARLRMGSSVKVEDAADPVKVELTTGVSWYLRVWTDDGSTPPPPKRLADGAPLAGYLRAEDLDGAAVTEATLRKRADALEAEGKKDTALAVLLQLRTLLPDDTSLAAEISQKGAALGRFGLDQKPAGVTAGPMFAMPRIEQGNGTVFSSVKLALGCRGKVADAPFVSAKGYQQPNGRFDFKAAPKDECLLDDLDRISKEEPEGFPGCTTGGECAPGQEDREQAQLRRAYERNEAKRRREQEQFDQRMESLGKKYPGGCVLALSVDPAALGGRNLVAYQVRIDAVSEEDGPASVRTKYSVHAENEPVVALLTPGPFPSPGPVQLFLGVGTCAGSETGVVATGGGADSVRGWLESRRGSETVGVSWRGMALEEQALNPQTFESTSVAALPNPPL